MPAASGGRIRLYVWLAAAGLALIAVSLLGPLLLQLLQWEASFSVSARSEVFVMETAQPTTPRWWVEAARIRYDDAPMDCGPAAPGEPTAGNAGAGRPFRGFVEVGDGAHVAFRRVADGPLTILIERAAAAAGEAGNAQAATLRAENETVRAVARDWLQLTIDPARHSFVAPLYGAGVVGTETYAPGIGEQPPLLTGGQVEVLDRTVVGSRRFQVMDVTLELGDEVSVLSRRDGTEGISDGAWIVQAGGEPNEAGLRVIGHMVGNELRIRHFGVQPFELRPSVWAYVAAEPLLQVLLIVVGSALLVVFERLMEMALARPEPPGGQAERGPDAAGSGALPGIASELGRTPLFAGLTPERMAAVAAIAEPLSLAEGAVLIDEGAVPASLYVVLDGGLELVQSESPAHVSPVFPDRRGPGDIIAEYAALDRHPAPARVQATAPSRLLGLPVAALEAMFEREPALAARIYRNMLSMLMARLRAGEAESEPFEMM